MLNDRRHRIIRTGLCDFLLRSSWRRTAQLASTWHCYGSDRAVSAAVPCEKHNSSADDLLADRKQTTMSNSVTMPVWHEKQLRAATSAAGVALWAWNVDTDAITMDEHAYELWEVSKRE